MLVAASGDTARQHLSDALPSEAQQLGIAVPDDVGEAMRVLDKFYIITSYPDALGGNVTAAFIAEEAVAAIERAQKVIALAESARENKTF